MLKVIKKVLSHNHTDIQMSIIIQEMVGMSLLFHGVSYSEAFDGTPKTVVNSIYDKGNDELLKMQVADSQVIERKKLIDFDVGEVKPRDFENIRRVKDYNEALNSIKSFDNFDDETKVFDYWQKFNYVAENNIAAFLIELERRNGYAIDMEFVITKSNNGLPKLNIVQQRRYLSNF